MGTDDRLPGQLTPDQALRQGRWVKLICGASNQDLPAIADLVAVFSAEGVHCVDVAADPAVVRAAREGLDWAESRFGRRPWLMVSLSDGADVHFRKAWFDPQYCPPECSRPCERVCPAEAIPEGQAINAQRCYGCGRCLPACPYGLIEERDHRLAPELVVEQLLAMQPDALEIHTGPSHDRLFEALVHRLAGAALPLQRLSVSCGLEGHAIAEAQLARSLWHRYSCLRQSGFRPLWQLDGRPMSGDVGAGTARAAVQLWRMMRFQLPPGPLQLAGGTNSATVQQLMADERPAGVAFGGVARRLLLPLLQDAHRRGSSLRDWPEGWMQARNVAASLVRPWAERPC